MKKRIVLIFLALILAIPCSLFALLNTEPGSRWLLRQLLSALPAQTSVSQIEGTLLEQIRLSELHYQTETETVDITRVNMAWRPWQLLAGHLHIVDISLDGVNVVIKPSQPSEASNFDWNADLPLPLQLILENLSITKLHYQNGDSQMELQYLKISALTEKNQLKLTSLTFAAQPFQAYANGLITLGKGFPFSLQSHWQFDGAEYGHWQADTDIQGDINQIHLNSQQSSPFKLELKGDLDQLADTPTINVQGDWQDLTWPLANAEPRLSSKQGHFEINGSLRDYHVALSGPLTQDYLPQAQLRFVGTGSTEAISIEDLQIASTAGSFQLNGRVDWANATAFELNANGQNFNPAIFVEELPGKLTFTTRVAGQLSDNSKRIQADIYKLKGRLRDKPVEAQGSLALTDETIVIDGLNIRSGRNRIDADGRLGPADSNLKFDIDTPALATLWPGLSGNLKGNGHIQGNWQNPDLRLQAKGGGLQFHEQRIGKLAIDLDYQADANKSSKLQLDASQIKTGSQEIDSLVFEATGSLKRHRFDLDLQSPMADLRAALEGGLDNNHWQGSLLKLTLDIPAAGNWQLHDPATIQTSMKGESLDANLSNTCLAQKSASICIAADYQANGEFASQLTASSLPTELLQPYLPDQFRLIGILDIDANLEQQKGLLIGSYRVDMPANAKAILKDATATHELNLGSLTVKGRLQDNLLTTDANLALVGNDFLRAQAELNIGPSKALSGQINASIQNLTLLKLLLPQLSDIRGLLETDVSINGTMSEPSASGSIHLSQASANLTSMGLSLREIDVQLATTNDPFGHLKLSGRAKSGDGLLTMQGFANLKGSADINLQGNDFEIAKLPEAQINISPDLRLIYSESGGKVSGQLNIPKAIITLAELPENAIAVSEDETILGQAKPEKKTVVEPGVDANIDIELGKQVSFSGLGLSTDLAGRLNLSKIGQQTNLHGTIDMKKGHYKSYGQDLTIRKGRFLFNGPVEAPWLDIEATRLSKSQDVTAVLSLSGPLKAPKTRIYSEPTLPESDALAYLITGSPLSQVGKSDANLVASAALSYGAGQLSWLKEKLGVDEFEVKQGKTLQDTLVAVGENLTENFYVGTKVGIFNKQAVLVLKHKLTKNLSVETQSGTSQRVKLNYEIDTD